MQLLFRCVLLAAVLATGCAMPEEKAAPVPALLVYAAGSLGRPLRAALDSFALRTGVKTALETAGSLETARKLTDLGKVPDVIALADEDVFPKFLQPEQVTWYARFARNRMVIAYAPRSIGVSDLTAATWWEVLTRPGVEVGRADASLDPAGYRALMVFQLAERHYRQPGLADRLTQSIPPRHIRPKSAELVALLQAGELDYAWEYESTARGAHLGFLELPPEIDLSDETRVSEYASARVRVLGARPGDTVEVRGGPIRYGFSIPRRAPHPEIAAEFARFMVSPAGRRIMRAEFLDALDEPLIVGRGAPAGLRQAARETPAAPSSSLGTPHR
jgi:molybdate/tungstate transport system substrate-binding protein